MEKLKKYKKQIVTFVTIFLLLEFGIFPSLTAQNLAFNFAGAIGLLLLLIWGFLELYEWVKKPGGFVDKEELKEAIETSEEELKRKSNPKQFDGVKSEEPFVKTRKPKAKKSEFPVEPHRKTVKKTNKTK
jgi:hypothetical protein